LSLNFEAPIWGVISISILYYRKGRYT